MVSAVVVADVGDALFSAVVDADVAMAAVLDAVVFAVTANVATTEAALLPVETKRSRSLAGDSEPGERRRD